MTEISDDVRAGVLGAVARGMSFDYAARADGIRVAEAEQIAKDAGWPNATKVYAEYRRLKDIPATGQPVAGLTGRPGVDTTRASEPDVVRRPRQPVRPRPDLSVARVQAHGLRIEQRAEVRRDGDQLVVTQAEQEYRGEVVQAGPTPEHREPLEAYVARVVAPIEADLTAELGMPGVRVEFDSTPLEFGGIPLVADPEVPSGTILVKDGAEVVAAINVEQLREQLFDVKQLELARALPPATDSPAPKPRQLPCEVCGVGVLTSYVEANGGRQRHGHHPDTA